MKKGFCVLFKKDCRMLVSGKFFLMAVGFLALYTVYVNLGYIRFMQMPPYNVYLYDPAGRRRKNPLWCRSFRPWRLWMPPCSPTPTG